MARMRSPAQRAPQNSNQARTLLKRFADLDAQETLVQAARDEAIARANQKADEELVTIVAAKKDIIKQLKPWWAASFEVLTGGKRKSIELGGCMLGFRLGQPTVSYAEGTDKDAAAALRAMGDDFAGYVRVSYAPDKAAIMKALEAEADLPPSDDGGEAVAKPLHDMGFSIKQTESFFVERLTLGCMLTA